MACQKYGGLVAEIKVEPAAPYNLTRIKAVFVSYPGNLVHLSGATGLQANMANYLKLFTRDV